MKEQVTLKTESGETYSYVIPNDKVVSITLNGEEVSAQEDVAKLTNRWDEGMKKWVKSICYTLLLTCFSIVWLNVLLLMR
jgi:hypothetical protein